MSIELKVPEVGESITEVQIAQWYKQVGQRAEKDENLVEIESDKATVELPAPVAGTITQILKQPGQRAQVGEVIGYMAAGAVAETTATAPPASTPSVSKAPESPDGKSTAAAPRIMPAAQRVLAQEGIRVEDVTTTGPGGRILKEDVVRTAENRAAQNRTAAAPAVPAASPARGELVSADLERELPSSEISSTGYPREEEFVVMSPIRRRIAERLVEAQQTAALLTTFNEVDMAAVIALRNEASRAIPASTTA